MLTDFDTENWKFAYDEPSKLGTMTTQDCVVGFKADGGSPTIYKVESADPHDPFGQTDVDTVDKLAVGYLLNWWEARPRHH